MALSWETKGRTLQTHYIQVNEAFEVICIEMTPGGTGRMPNLMQVANHQKSEMVDARDHAS